MNELLISPSGTLTSVPTEEVDAAIKDGFSKAPAPNPLLAVSPSGVLTSLSKEEKDAALKDGFKSFDEIHQHHQKLQEISKKIDDGKLDLPGNDVSYGPFDKFAAGLTGKTIPPSNPAIQDAAGNYKMVVDGKPIDIPPGELTGRLAQNPNLKFADPQAQLTYEAYLQKNTGTEHVVEGFGKGFGAGTDPAMKLTIEDPAVRSGGKLDIIADRVAALTKFQKQETIGNVAGGLATIPVTGGANRAFATGAKEVLAPAGSGIIRGVTGRIASEAIAAPVLAAPDIAGAMINRDPEAAKEAVWDSVKFGGIVGAGSEVLGAGLKGVGKLADLAKAPLLDAALEQYSPKVKSALENVDSDTKEKFIQTLKDEGFSAKSTPEEFDALTRKLAAGEAKSPLLGKLNEVLMKSAEGVPGELNSARIVSRLESFGTKLSMSGEQLSLLSPELEAGEKQLSLLGPGQTVKQAALTDADKVIQETAADIEKATTKEGSIPLEKLQELAQTVENRIDWSKNDVLNNARKEIFNALSSQVDMAGSKAVALSNDTKLAAAWGEAQGVTGLASKIRDIGPLDIGDLKNPIFTALKKVIESKGVHYATHAITGGVGAVGHGIPGYVAGVAINEAVHAAAKKLIAHIENTGASKMTPWLANKTRSASIGSYLVMDAVHNMSNKIDQIPEVLKSIGIKGATSFAGSNNPIKDILGPTANGLSKEQQFNRLASTVSMMQGNPQVRDQHLRELTAPIATHHPALANALVDDATKKIEWLAQVMPKDPNPPKPFQHNTNFKPSKAQMDEFESQLRIAQNPYGLIEELKNGRVTPKQVAVAAQLNPAILSHIRAKLEEAAYSGKSNMTYQQRLSASLIMGQSMDESLNKVQQLQSIYGPSQQSSAPAPPPPKQRGKGGSHINPDKLPAAKETQAQRLLFK